MATKAERADKAEARARALEERVESLRNPLTNAAKRARRAIEEIADALDKEEVTSVGTSTDELREFADRIDAAIYGFRWNGYEE